MATAEGDSARQSEELEALMAFYGKGTVQVLSQNQSSNLSAWRIQIRPNLTLEIHVPERYPSLVCPQPTLQGPQYLLDSGTKRRLEGELVDLWSQDVEVAILWAEHVRAELDNETDEFQQRQQEGCDSTRVDDNDNHSRNVDESNDNHDNDDLTTFVPATSKFGQPMRKFFTAVLRNPANACDIFHGPPYHPSKSGSSETMIAHVAHVTSMDQVHWVWGQLLFHGDHANKLSRASHNMMAYRFFATNANDGNVDEQQSRRALLVSDNDDDGEKGAGMKLAALLELAHVDNVMVVVSRWYGGVQLGAARFKYFASVARDALEQFGFLDDNKKGTEFTAAAKSNSRKR